MVKRLRLRASSSRCPSSTSSFTNTFLGIQRRSGSCELQKGPISVCSYRLSTAPQSHPQGEICSALRRLLRSRTDHTKRWSVLREVAATAVFRLNDRPVHARFRQAFPHELRKNNSFKLMRVCLTPRPLLRFCLRVERRGLPVMHRLKPPV